MIVRELIEELKQFDENMPVYITDPDCRFCFNVEVQEDESEKGFVLLVQSSPEPQARLDNDTDRFKLNEDFIDEIEKRLDL